MKMKIRIGRCVFRFQTWDEQSDLDKATFGGMIMGIGLGQWLMYVLLKFIELF